jgi:Fur family ferric uptake transcriptional regulator
MTAQRQVILEELRRMASHPTDDEVYLMARRRLPRISLGTVYRSLEALARQGTIQRLDLGGTPGRFDGDSREHYHVRCLHCGRVEDAPVRPVFDNEDALRGLSDFEIVGHRLEFIGFCPECKKTPATAARESPEHEVDSASKAE